MHLEVDERYPLEVFFFFGTSDSHRELYHDDQTSIDDIPPAHRPVSQKRPVNIETFDRIPVVTYAMGRDDRFRQDNEVRVQ